MIAGIGDDDADGKKAILEVVDLKDLAFLRGVEGLGSDGDLFLWYGSRRRGKQRRPLAGGRSDSPSETEPAAASRRQDSKTRMTAGNGRERMVTIIILPYDPGKARLVSGC
jgi:hypothetical protein